MKQIGNIIREHRVAQNLTQEELGKELHVTKQAVSKWETGRTLPDVETLRRLSDVLSIDLSVLLDGSLKGAAKSNRRKTAWIVALSGLLLVLITGLAVVWIQDNVRPEYLVYGRNTPNPDATVVTVEELLVNPKKYDGLLVRVMGVGSLQDEFNCLYASYEDWEYDTESAVGLVWGECSPEYDRAWTFNGNYVTVEGFFDADDSACGKRFYSSIRDVNLYEKQWPVHKETEQYARVTKEQNGTYTLTVFGQFTGPLYTRQGLIYEPHLSMIDSKTLRVISDNTYVFCDVYNQTVSPEYTRVLWCGERALIQLVVEEDRYYVVTHRDALTDSDGERILLEGAVPQKARKTVEAYEVEDALQVTYYISSTEKKTMIIPCPEE